MVFSSVGQKLFECLNLPVWPRPCMVGILTTNLMIITMLLICNDDIPHLPGIGNSVHAQLLGSAWTPLALQYFRSWLTVSC